MDDQWNRIQAFLMQVFLIAVLVLSAPRVAFASNELTWFDFFQALAVFAIGPFLSLLIIIDSTVKRGEPIGGWLRLYSWQAYAIGLVAVVSVASLVSELSVYGWEPMRPYFLVDFTPVASQLILLAQAGLAFRMRVVEHRKWKLINLLRLGLLANIVAAAVSLWLSGRMWSNAPLFTFIGLFWATAWLPYFTFSKRVQAVFLTNDWPDTEQGSDAQNGGAILKPGKIVRKGRTPRKTLVLFAILGVSCATYLNIRMSEQYFRPEPQVYGRSVTKQYVNKRYDVYLLMKLCQSQDRAISVLADSLKWFKANPTGDGNMESGKRVSAERAAIEDMPWASRGAEQLRQETVTLYRNIEDVSPETSLRESMTREVNNKTISSIFFRLKAVRSRTRKTLADRRTRLRQALNSPWPTKIARAHIEVYEELVDTLPKQQLATGISQDLLNRLVASRIAAQVPGGQSAEELPELAGRKRVVTLVSVDPALKQDPLIKKYLALRNQRILALTELENIVGRTAPEAYPPKELEKNLSGAAMDAYVQSTLGLFELRKEIKSALFGKGPSRF